MGGDRRKRWQVLQKVAHVDECSPEEIWSAVDSMLSGIESSDHYKENMENPNDRELFDQKVGDLKKQSRKRKPRRRMFRNTPLWRGKDKCVGLVEGQQENTRHLKTEEQGEEQKNDLQQQQSFRKRIPSNEMVHLTVRYPDASLVNQEHAEQDVAGAPETE